ncbi:SPW repeat domain-containing protein [Amycolatopsis sp. H20-H5]|uniref:SPW repeat domain-containing protein n=1 Tax=Amycolatopsis sp. H20-H5 TaxID=3046309 RepID=UPI002DB7F68B|nr:hypothetical protein [Amycolatopsis sp. H20-H5]MEC3975825.1 hypothetical protein [Amycolatopsis sp. H20-H5]
MVDQQAERYLWIGPGTDSRVNPSLPSSFVFLDALWLGFAPFVLHHGVAASGFAATNDVMIAIIVVASALARIVAPKNMPWLSLLNAALGLWLIVAALALRPAGMGVSKIDDLVMGALLLALGGVSAVLTYRQRADVGPR